MSILIGEKKCNQEGFRGTDTFKKLNDLSGMFKMSDTPAVVSDIIFIIKAKMSFSYHNNRFEGSRNSH